MELLTTPRHIRQLMDLADPRAIDLRVWARLVMAAATPSQNDLPQGTTTYPLSLYRALALIWVTSARRPNEIVRLRLDCVRADVAPELLGESDQAIEYLTILASRKQQEHQEERTKAPLLHYLHIPSGKTKVMRDKLRKVNPPPKQPRHFGVAPSSYNHALDLSHTALRAESEGER